MISSIWTFDFTTFYTTIQHDKFKAHLRDSIDKCFLHRNGKDTYKASCSHVYILTCKRKNIQRNRL